MSVTVSMSRAEAQKLYDFCTEHNQSEFCFAKDHGAYFCATKVEDTNVVIYMKGCNPKTDEDWWDEAYYRFGGDDFGVHLPIKWLELFLTHPHFKAKRRMSVRINQNSVRLIH